LSHSETTAFYDGYLPDPLGGSAMALRGYAEQTMRAKQNLTLISALVHRFKRSLRKKLTAWKLWALAHVAIQICDIFDVFA
jgi:hypothetical protein